MQATRNGVRVGELKDPEAFAAKLRILNTDGSKRFGSSWQYDVDTDIEKYVEIARKVSVCSIHTSAAIPPKMHLAMKLFDCICMRP